MSSILRALKKLDEDTTLQKNDSEGGSKQPLYRPHKSILVINRFLLVLSTFLLLVITGWLIRNSTVKPTIEKKQETSSPESSSSIIVPQASQPSPSAAAHEPASITETRGSINTQLPQPIKEETPLQALQPPQLRQPSAVEEEKNSKSYGLNLKGILWSQVKERRLALINDLYLKEGDKIEGAVIIRIEKNGVTMQAGKKTWTIGLKK